MHNSQSDTTTLQKIFRILLGLFMLIAAIGHLTINRQEFQALVPNWVPLGKDLVVILSGLIEGAFGLAIIFWKKQRIRIGVALAIFFVLVFPGNIAQYFNHTDAFNLNTDNARLARLFFQPVLILWALWCTGVFKDIRRKYK